MESIGIKKDIDKLGRICIPKDIKELFKFESEIEIRITKDGVLLTNPEYILVKKSER